MEVNYFGAAATAVFMLQLAFCLKRVKLLLRLLPAVLLLAGIAGCGIVYAVTSGFGAATAGIILAALLALDGLAWLAAFLVKNRM